MYPFVGLQIVEDEFEKTTNFDQMYRTEDRFLGTRYGFRLGYSPSNSVSLRHEGSVRGDHRGRELGGPAAAGGLVAVGI